MSHAQALPNLGAWPLLLSFSAACAGFVLVGSHIGRAHPAHCPFFVLHTTAPTSGR